MKSVKIRISQDYRLVHTPGSNRGAIEYFRVKGSIHYRVGSSKTDNTTFEELFAAYCYLLDIKCPIKLKTHRKTPYIGKNIRGSVRKLPACTKYIGRIGCQSITEVQANRVVKALAEILDYEIIKE